MLFLNEQGQMEILATEQHLLSMATDGILSLKNVNESQNPLRYEAISQSRFSILFAILDSHQIWRLRFRAVLTPVNGLLVFKLHSTLPVESGMYKIPQKERNVIAVIGLKPKSQRIDAMCSVFTTENTVVLLDSKRSMVKKFSMFHNNYENSKFRLTPIPLKIGLYP